MSTKKTVAPVDASDKTIEKKLLDRLARLLRGSKRAFPLRDLFRATKRKERAN